ncbi:MAG: hypothetical protein ACPHF4_01585, partial [Rubripirellula sp.]
LAHGDAGGGEEIDPIGGLVNLAQCREFTIGPRFLSGRMSTVRTFTTSRNHIAGIAVTELAEKFGTPVYVYDQQVIDQ